MATYVTSDAHGHVRALDEALEAASPAADDTVYVLGDMIDRGPDPVGVIRLVRGLPNVRVLMGNHERMMLDTLAVREDMDDFLWAINGGSSTMAGLDALPREEFVDVVDWISHLPLYDVIEVAGRTWILVHAGIDALEARAFLATAGVELSPEDGAAGATREQLQQMMAAQDPENLVWIREPFWGHPTGFVGTSGAGPVVIAGHTPSILLSHYADRMEGDGTDGEGRGAMVRVGACAETGGEPDRIDIDCSAAAGAGQGRVGVMRLDDGEIFYAAIRARE